MVLLSRHSSPTSPLRFRPNLVAKKSTREGIKVVRLLDSDIKTREVLDWKGLHLIHYMGSSCSQKVRIFLNLKGIEWESHTIDLLANENVEPWFLGINPRGLAPVLVHNGAVHIESNDMVQYLENVFPEPRLIPPGRETEVAALLKHEDDLHLDLRTLSFRFVFNPPGPPKTPEQLEKYRINGTGTVRGQKDEERNTQLGWWQRAAKEGYTDETTRAAAQNFRKEFDALDETLGRQPYLLGQNLTVLDIAWFIYVHRLSLAGYPFERLHPNVATFVKTLRERPEFGKEVATPPEFDAHLDATRKAHAQAGKTLEMVAGL
jgi:glutathione S-transferase